MVPIECPQSLARIGVHLDLVCDLDLGAQEVLCAPVFIGSTDVPHRSVRLEHRCIPPVLSHPVAPLSVGSFDVGFSKPVGGSPFLSLSLTLLPVRPMRAIGSTDECVG